MQVQLTEVFTRLPSRRHTPWATLIIIFVAAAADTTTSTILTLILAMVLHPEVQKRAQAEVDAVVKARGRLPDFEDMSAMPYVECCITEALRYESSHVIHPDSGSLMICCLVRQVASGNSMRYTAPQY